MVFRVQKVEEQGDLVVYTLSGRIQSGQLEELRTLLQGEERKVILYLDELSLVSHEGVSFLAHCEANGVELRNCPAYVRKWIEQEPTPGSGAMEK